MANNILPSQKRPENVDHLTVYDKKHATLICVWQFFWELCPKIRRTLYCGTKATCSRLPSHFKDVGQWESIEISILNCLLEVCSSFWPTSVQSDELLSVLTHRVTNEGSFCKQRKCQLDHCPGVYLGLLDQHDQKLRFLGRCFIKRLAHYLLV